MADPAHLDFRDMLENSPAAYISLLPNGRIEYVNRTFLTWTGHRRDSMIGKRLSDFLTMADRSHATRCVSVSYCRTCSAMP